MARGRVQGGRRVVDERIDMPDETEIQLALIVGDDADAIADDLDPEDRARLHAAIRVSFEQIEQGEVVPIEDVLAEL
jgi:hypothetical protein